MGRSTGIDWTDRTFNFWWGCWKISDGCKNCYAAAFDHRLGQDYWQRSGPRWLFKDDHFKEPYRWNREAERTKTRIKVFPSMMDPFEDHPMLVSERARMWKIIRETPHLDWQLLTKRPENILSMLPDDWGQGYPNVWLGTTLEHQKYSERVNYLAAVPAMIRFLSIEPMLGRVTIGLLGAMPRTITGGAYRMCWEYIHWVIAGCESGHHARPTEVEWLRALRDECAEVNVPFFLKQAEPASVLGNGELATEGAALVTIGKGSTVKDRGKVIKLPYLDGVQHAAFPERRAA